MKLLWKFRRGAAMAAAMLFCLTCLTGCTAIDFVKTSIKNKQIDVRSLLGMSTDDEEEDALFIEAELGGEDVPYPDGFDTTAKMATAMNGSTMCIVFHNLGNAGRSTGYFSPLGSSITLTAAATTESPSMFTYKAALWKKVDGGSAYVEGCTVKFTCDGELYTADITGLDSTESYKLIISYDSGSYYLTGGMSVEGLSTGEDVDIEADEAAQSGT